jgi:AraC family transcriptional regulator
VEWRWPTPLDVVSSEDRHMLEMSLPPFATDGVATFPDIPAARAAHIGPMFVRPAQVALRARSQGGRIQVVRCAVEPAQYARIAEDDVDWTERELRAGMHLRSETLKTVFHLLRRELMEPSFGSVALVDAYATALIVETARTLANVEATRAEGRLAAWQYRRINERLAENEAPPTVAELAALCGVSPRHLLRLYRNLSGETVTAHIQRTQIQRAQALLRTTDLPLKEIAARLGFARSGSFATAFRRATGATPRLYRQSGGG